MKRFHVHVHVADLDKSIGFYSTMFGAAPARVETDYAKWMLDAHRNFKRPLACLWPLESPTDAWVAGRYRPGWLGTDGCDIVLS